MNAQLITLEEYESAVGQRKKADEIIQGYGKQQANDFQERWKKYEAGEQFFTDCELLYSAGARCEACNAGLAYPKNCTGFHQWDCSAALKGEHKERHASYSFAFYEIKSEGQPSAHGATTRPKS